MRNELFSIWFVLTIFSSQSFAKPVWFDFNFEVPSSLKSDQYFIDTLNEIIESEGARKLSEENHKLIVSRIVSSELVNEDILEKLIEAIRLSQYELARKNSLINKYLLKILNSKKASVRISLNILNFIRAVNVIADDNLLIIKNIISKHKGSYRVSHRAVLISTVHAVLVSKVPSMDEVKHEVIKSVIFELKDNYLDLCFTLQVLDDYRYADPATLKSNDIYDKDKHVGFTLIPDRIRENLKAIVLSEMGKLSSTKEAKDGCPNF